MGIKGVTLIELMAAIVLVSLVVSGMSLFLPRASKAVISNRFLTTAKNLAIGRIQEEKQKPYAYVTPTAPPGPFPTAQVTIPPLAGCNCSAIDVNPDNFPVDSTVVDDKVTYTRRVCINLVERSAGAWVAHCPDDPITTNSDHGLKSIRVRVTYAWGGNTQSIDAESLVTR